jgi:type IV secretory pathway TraG/TraD family ATPase VirD4
MAADRPRVTVLEGMTIEQTPKVAGAAFQGQRVCVLRGHEGALRFDDEMLSRHVLFLGGIGTGKTNAMTQLLAALRSNATADDVFIVFDTKGDFLDRFYADDDAVISADPGGRGGRVWNLFSDVAGLNQTARTELIYEIASTIFSADLARAGQNFFFAAAARDVFAGVADALVRSGEPVSNADLAASLDKSSDDIADLLLGHDDLAGTARYLENERTAEGVLSFLQQALNTSFSGVFRGAGTFSVRGFVRDKGRRALFVEYDIARGSSLLPAYRVLIDMAIKEALNIGRRRRPGNVYFIFDEFTLLPSLQHVADGINFGRGLGLKFVVATQNVSQVLASYGEAAGRSILSGFGTVFGFRMMDNDSRDLIRQRYGTNRKQIILFAAVRSEGVQQIPVLGHVIEDWDLSGLAVGQCIVSLPEGPPFLFPFAEAQS